MAASTSEAKIAASDRVPLMDLPEALPEALTEKILRRLAHRDYIRFGAVCRGWRAIQRDHPMPPLNIPWFLPSRRRQESVVCSVGLHSSEEEQRLHIPFSPGYLAGLERNEAAEGAGHPSFRPLPYGWLLFDDRPLPSPVGCHQSYEFSLLNPITGVQIRLPILRDLHSMFRATISPPPRCDVFVITPATWGSNIHLYRRGNPNWTHLLVNRHASGVPGASPSVIHYDGKFYCFRSGNGLMVVDTDCPTEDPIEPHFLDMDQSLLPNFRREARLPSLVDMLRAHSFNQLSYLRSQDPMSETFLVESNGKMLLVCHFYGSDLPFHSTCDLVRFELFEADLSNRRWVKADGLGDHAILIYRNLAVSLVAADVGVEQNCIYVVESTMNKEKQAWNMFDLSTGEVADSSLPFTPSPSSHLMFVPSIY